MFFNFAGDLVQFVGNFIAAKRRQAGQTQFQDRLRLLFGKLVGAALCQFVARVGNEFDQRRHILRRPVARHQLLFGIRRRRRGADQLDDFVDVGNGDSETDQDMRPVAGFVQQVFDAPRHDLLPEGGERLQHIFQSQAFGPPSVDRKHVGAEGRLQVGILVEVVQHDIGDGVTLQFDDDANTFAV